MINNLPSVVYAYINSEQPQDKARALELCQEYGLDYDTMRRAIFDRMVAYEHKRLGTAPTLNDFMTQGA